MLNLSGQARRHRRCERHQLRMGMRSCRATRSSSIRSADAAGEEMATGRAAMPGADGSAAAASQSIVRGLVQPPELKEGERLGCSWQMRALGYAEDSGQYWGGGAAIGRCWRQLKATRVARTVQQRGERVGGDANSSYARSLSLHFDIMPERNRMRKGYPAKFLVKAQWFPKASSGLVISTSR
uniref:Uncharacterized protein n=1 Tax=Macrostomum lignano TaxID=282301 RepID=A0A1I8FN20_9PLAT